MKKMQTAIKCIIFLILLATTGCGIKDEELCPTNLVILSGNHSNAPVPPINSELVRQAIYESALSCSSISIVIVDGQPYVAGDYLLSSSKKKLSKQKKDQIAKKQRASLLSVLQKSKAQTPEVDTMGAITLAARGIKDKQGEKKLLILDSGLSTAGIVNFDNGLLYEEPETIVNSLKEQSALPDLTGYSITWTGLGDVSSPQEPLLPADIQNLQKIWNAILQASGAEVKFINGYPSVEKDDGLPQVSTILLNKEKPILNQNKTMEEKIVLNEEKILFQPDTADFADYDEAIKTLRPIAKILKENQIHIGLAGTTATLPTNEECKQLSLERAEAVRQLLIKLGVDEGKIKEVIGIGYEHEFHIPDIDEQGFQNEKAPLNRTVIIFDIDSEEGIKLLKYK